MKDKRLIIPFIIIFLMILSVIIYKFTSFGQNLFTNASENNFLPFAIIIASIIDSINPCALSVLFVTIAFLFSTGADRKRILKIGGIYILGIFLVYIMIGLGILQTLTIFGIPNIVSKIGASILILFGVINFINDFYPKFPIKLKIPELAKGKIASLMSKATYPASFILGVFVGLSEFPCTGGPYLIVLGLLHDNETFFSGFLYLVLYNIIFILPLIVSLIIASDKLLLEKAENWKKQKIGHIKLWSGIAMIILGIIMLAL